MAQSENFPIDKYDFKKVEEKVWDVWEATDVYKWDPSLPRDENYVIDTPPPTVSGALHIGHAFSYTQTDFQARFFRMRGKNVFYPIGFDDNGLPTERLVESRRKVRAADMSREEFVKLCHEVVQDVEDDFRALYRRLGVSYDWSLEYTTISPHAWKISQLSLLDLYQQGHLYREPQPTLWDPVDQTAIAQAELEEIEKQGVLYDIAFELENGEEIVIATTRPELLPACVAVMYHPEDGRAGALAGKKAYSALFGAAIPMVADEGVDREKGTGLVMCCTFVDPKDIEWWRTHDLPLRNIVAKNGTLGNMSKIGNKPWPAREPRRAKTLVKKLDGQHVRKARPMVLEMLGEAGLIRGETPVTQMIPSAERSKSPVEILVTDQWMIRLLDKKERLIDYGRQMTWHPPFMQQRYEDWVNNLKWDWCVSRQRYFGVPAPFWYSKRPGEEGKILPAHVDDLPVNPLTDAPRGYTRDEVEPDPDVLDTWATSSVSPQINSHAISESFAIDYDRHRRTFPADLRPQSHEIIRTWLFYTMLKAALHENVAPFKDIAVSGWVMAEGGEKMSKSKGNIVEPKKVLDQSGSDIMRYWSASGRLGRDTAFSSDLVKIGKRLATKLWNASKLCRAQLGDHVPAAQSAADAIAAGQITDNFDLWIIGRARATIEEATAAFEKYDYTSALEATERFFWNDYTGNYLELCKGRLYGDLESETGNETGVKDALFFTHSAVLKLFAPVMPYISDYLFQSLFGHAHAAPASVHARGGWPELAAFPASGEKIAPSLAAIDILNAVRKYKSTHELSMAAPIARIAVAPTASAVSLDGVMRDLSHTVRAAEIALVEAAAADAEVVDGPDGLVRIVVEMAA